MEDDPVWEPIESFETAGQFEHLCEWLVEQLRVEKAQEIPVGWSFAGLALKERWFVRKASREIWRLVEPQEPFRGFWGRV